MFNPRNLMCLVAVTPVGATPSVGRSSQTVTQPAAGPTASAGWRTGLDKDVVTASTQLGEDDRKAALAQKVCPVTDEPLGSMGKPPQLTVEGQQVFLCCVGCEDQLRKEPPKFLAKLKAE